MESETLSDKILCRYHMVMRFMGYAFAASSALYCLIVSNLQTASTPGPFGVSPQDMLPFSKYFPLFGVGFMSIGVLFHRKVPLSRWFLKSESIQRIQIFLILLLVRLMLLQIALIPAMFYFLLGYGSECILIFGLSGIILMLIGIPKINELRELSTLQISDK